MIATRHNTTKRPRTKQLKEQARLQAKRHSPGVPPNTCPYVDMCKTIVADMADAYTRAYERGEAQPAIEDMRVLLDDTLEHVRRANETLRDNSAYWYNKYKQTL